MSDIKACIGVFRENGVVVEDPSLFNENELVIVLSGDSYSEYIKKMKEEVKSKE